MPTTQPAPVTTDDFEVLYADAQRDATRVPWADARPHAALVSWLNAIAPSLIRCGARVAVVGCGLGEDARELVRRGYDVTAFDCSPTAIEWAREIDAAHASCFHVADLFDLPTRWMRRFDLVIEINTIQALPPDRREDVLEAIASLLSPHGHLLTICRGREEDAPLEGPPWPLTRRELLAATAAAGLELQGMTDVFHDDETPPVLRMRALFRRRPS
ncbi:MAG: class I SAM-dependent methyltransferase [Planctomycetota bacterium]|jgi:SAM-dependent methyltransferase